MNATYAIDVERAATFGNRIEFHAPQMADRGEVGHITFDESVSEAILQDLLDPLESTSTAAADTVSKAPNIFISFSVSVPTQIDFSSPEGRDRFFKLQSKVGRKIATEEEQASYNEFLLERQRKVREKTAIADYLELRRLAEIQQKLQELKQLFKPIARRTDAAPYKSKPGS